MKYTKHQVSMAMMDETYNDLDAHYRTIVMQLSSSLTDSKLSTIFKCMSELCHGQKQPYYVAAHYLFLAAKLHEGLQLIDEENNQ